MASNIGDIATNALQQAWEGLKKATNWAQPPPISPLASDYKHTLIEPGGIKQAVNNLVAMTTARPQLVRNFPQEGLGQSLIHSAQDLASRLNPSNIMGKRTQTPATVPITLAQGMNRPSPTNIPQVTPTTMMPTTTSTMPTATPTPDSGVTPYPTPRLSQGQTTFAQTLVDAGKQAGLTNPDLTAAIAFNEASLRINPAPNITEKEETYGPAGINIRAHPEITREQAENPSFAKQFLVNRLKAAQRIFPNDVERQILFYNVPGNVLRAREEGGGLRPAEELSYEAAWYLQNALKYLNKVPSPEYLSILQNYGFFK